MFEFFPQRLAALCATVACATCASAAPASAPTPANARLHDTHWTLQHPSASVPTTPATPATPATPDTHLVLEARSQHLRGFAGCNRLRGRYTQRGTQLVLKPLATTRKLCAPAVMQQEEHLLQTLAGIDGYRIEGPVLSLLEGDVVKARFKARAVR